MIMMCYKIYTYYFLSFKLGNSLYYYQSKEINSGGIIYYYLKQLKSLFPNLDLIGILSPRYRGAGSMELISTLISIFNCREQQEVLSRTRMHFKSYYRTNRYSVRERPWLQTLVQEASQPSLTRYLWTPPTPMLSLRYNICLVLLFIY